MSFIDEYLIEILGDKSLATWLASFTFVLIGSIVSLRVIAFTRDKTSDTTPYKFNLWFMFRDNAPRLIGSIFVAFSFIRFGEQLTGKVFNDFMCFVLGLAFDVALYFLAEWSKKARDKFKSN